MVSLDASFLIDLIARRRGAEAKAADIERRGETVFVTAPAVSEVLVGASRAGARYRERTEAQLAGIPMLPFDFESCLVAGRIGAELMERGKPIGVADLFIASISIRHGHALVTRDTDFDDIPGLQVDHY